MATVMNRSPYRVSVKKHPELSREFPYNQLHLAQAYADNELKEYKAVVSQGSARILVSTFQKGYKAIVSQGECRILVRIRQKGHKDQNFFVSSYDAANDAIARIESERRRSLFIDYTNAHRVTLAELMQRYM